MLSKSKIKYLKSLQQKKVRTTEHVFLVEGTKAVLEFIASKFTTVVVYGTELFYEQHKEILSIHNVAFEIANSEELAKAGSFVTNSGAIAVVEMPELSKFIIPKGQWILALDRINDPGNLGAIIRIADWYGITTVLTSKGSVDVYNPKVVNASKGSLSRVAVHNVNFNDILATYSGVVYGAMLEGKDIHKMEGCESGIILLGSEAQGIEPSLLRAISHQVTIPRFGGAESLNVAMATAIICDNLLVVRE